MNPHDHSRIDPAQIAAVEALTGKSYMDCTERELFAAGMEPISVTTRRRVDQIVLKRLGKPWADCTMAELDGLLLTFEAEAACKDAVIERLEREADE